jgi:hypothetical protein
MREKEMGTELCWKKLLMFVWMMEELRTLASLEKEEICTEF